MRFAILPLVSQTESQFVPARDDVLIEVAPFGCAPSDQMTTPTPVYKPLAPCLALEGLKLALCGQVLLPFLLA